MKYIANISSQTPNNRRKGNKKISFTKGKIYDISETNLVFCDEGTLVHLPECDMKDFEISR